MTRRSRRLRAYLASELPAVAVNTTLASLLPPRSPAATGRCPLMMLAVCRACFRSQKVDCHVQPFRCSCGSATRLPARKVCSRCKDTCG